ncbi:hypothetical protein [Stappia sp. ES.058]|uniref:hypothetical protein n=1 Tax=Stappia sp. ES.058 TaxID=1881061 RepID=UPI001FCCD8F0|nr:hypothetical protein [Stappia sp. ES.058]
MDAPQPFVENMPVLNAKSAGAGGGSDTAKAKDEEASGDDEDRGRRRTRGTRGRGLRKARNPGQGDEAGAGDAAQGDTPAANGPSDAAAGGGETAEPAAEPKPKARRTPRPRTPKAAAPEEKSETPATNDA